MRKAVPSPGSLSTPMCPRSASRCRRPWPARGRSPCPCALVVKKGSKARASVSARPCRCRVADRELRRSRPRHRRSPRATRPRRQRPFAVSIAQRPPSGMASRALTARLMQHLLELAGSASTVPRPRARHRRARCPRRSARRSIPHASTTASRSITRGCSTCWRLKASSWRVSRRPRVAACGISRDRPAPGSRRPRPAQQQLARSR